MFQRESYTATYKAPILATGEPARQAASNAGAMQSFTSNERQFVPASMRTGVRAGSKGSRYRNNIAALSAAAQAPGYQSEYLSQLADNAQAKLQFEQGAAGERDANRRLLFDMDQTQLAANTALRGDVNARQLGAAQREANYQIGYQNRRGLPLGWLGSLLY